MPKRKGTAKQGDASPDQERMAKRAKELTVPVIDRSMAAKARNDVQDIQTVPQTKRLHVVGDTILVAAIDVRESTTKMRRYGSPRESVTYAQGIHTGLKYARDVAMGARRGGRIVDRHGRTHKQKRGSVV